MIIFGDSYVAAADRGRPGFARLAPVFLGWRGAHMGRGGTGFVKSSPGRLPYSDRLPDLLASTADVLIVQATGNDATCDLPSVRAEASAFLTAATRKFPRVIVLGPMWAKDGVENLPELRDLTRDVCAEVGVQFIDALGWLSGRWIGVDGAHPTRLGHALIAIRLVGSIRRS